MSGPILARASVNRAGFVAGLVSVLALAGLSGCGTAGGSADETVAQDTVGSRPAGFAATPRPTVQPRPRDRSRAQPDSVRSEELVDEALRPAEAASERGIPGFAQLVIAGQMAGEIWWKDPPPEITAMEGTTKSGVTVTVVRVAFSDAELTSAMAKAYSSSSVSEDLPQSIELRPNAAYDGIELGFLPDTYDRMDQVTVAKRYEEIVGMPVAIYATDGATDT